MKLIPTSSDEFVGFNLWFVIYTLLLCGCLYSNIQTGSLLLSYGLGEKLVQGKLEQIIQFPGEVGEIYKIGFNDEQGDKRHFYQYHRNRSVRALGAPLYFHISSEGIVLNSEPVFARPLSDKVCSVVLLSIAFAYMTFTSLILIKGRVAYGSRAA